MTGQTRQACPNRADRRHPERQGYASRRDVADYLGMTVSALDHWAVKDKGPAFVRIGKHTRYAWRDVYAWLDAQPKGGAA